MDHEVTTMKQAQELYAWLEDRLTRREMSAVTALMAHTANTVLEELGEA